MADEIVKKKKNPVPVIIIAVVASLILIGGIVFAVSAITAGAKKKAVKEQVSLGDKYLTDLDYENAILAYEEALKIDPKCKDAYLGEAAAYDALVDDALKKGDTDAAEKYLEDAIEAMERGVSNTNNREIKDYLQHFKDRLINLIGVGGPVYTEPGTPVEPAEPEEQDLTDEELFTMIAGSYVCTPGENWCTYFDIYGDGTMSGAYTEYDFSGARAYEVESTGDFFGRFANAKKVSDTIYTVELVEIRYSQEVGTSEVTSSSMGQIIHEYTEAKGIAGGKTFYVYLRGTNVSDISEDFFVCSGVDKSASSTMPVCGIFNADAGYGFGQHSGNEAGN